MSTETAYIFMLCVIWTICIIQRFLTSNPRRPVSLPTNLWKSQKLAKINYLSCVSYFQADTHTPIYSRAYSFGHMIFHLISLHKVSSAGGSHISDVIRLLPISTSRFRFLLFTKLHSPSSFHRNGSVRDRDGRSLQSSTRLNSYWRFGVQQQVKEHSCLR